MQKKPANFVNWRYWSSILKSTVAPFNPSQAQPSRKQLCPLAWASSVFNYPVNCSVFSYKANHFASLWLPSKLFSLWLPSNLFRLQLKSKLFCLHQATKQTLQFSRTNQTWKNQGTPLKPKTEHPQRAFETTNNNNNFIDLRRDKKWTRTTLLCCSFDKLHLLAEQQCQVKELNPF